MHGWGADIEDAEKAWHGWTEACAATKTDKCEYAAFGNGTAEGIDKFTNDLLTRLQANYTSGNGFVTITTRILDYLYHSGAWQALSYVLASWATGEPAVAAEVDKWKGITFPGYSPLTAALGLVRFAISCGDSIDLDGSTTEDALRELVRLSQTVSPKFGGLISGRSFCHRWTTRAVERLSGSMNVKPKNVVLVIGNSMDPITPFRAAKLVASAAHLGSQARLVRFEAIGHATGELTI